MTTSLRNLARSAILGGLCCAGLVAGSSAALAQNYGRGYGGYGSNSYTQSYVRTYNQPRYTYKYRCDRDGDDCVTYRCDSDGDDCVRIRTSQNDRYYRPPQIRCDRDGDDCRRVR